jgi:hypothetical protein
MKAAVWLLSAALILSSCMTNTHIVGDGGTGGQAIAQRHWYILWGLAEINKVDSAEMAGGAKDYTIETEMSVVDFVISIFTSIVTVECMTTTVTK